MGMLSEKVAIVTGATSGIGRGIAEAFAGEEAAVAVAGRDTARGNEIVNTIEKDGGRALFIHGDLTLPEENRKLVAETVDVFGGLDVMVMSAGDLGIGSVTDVDLETWHRAVNINFNAVFYLLKYGIPEMKKRGGGAVVVIGSIAAFHMFPNHPAYCASKGALVPLVKQVALDYGPQIRINLIHPAQVDTPLLRNSVKAFDNPESIIQETENRLPMKRIGLPDDVAQAALYLVSEKASWITGAGFVVDGGFLCT
jgi:NAD(P)-dependent dehydrogenase (short-subunit alcohol dehydrogenase family)